MGDALLLDLAGIASRPELLIAIKADLLHVLAGRLVEVAGVKVGWISHGCFPHSGSEGESIVCVDVHLANTVANPFLDLFHGHSIGLGDRTTVLVDHLQPLLGN